MDKMAPFLFLARAANEQDKFYETFFKVWFERWPITPSHCGRNDSENDSSTISSVEELKKKVKKVRRNSLIVAVCHSNVLLPF
jgi:hypothetical protein